MLTDEREWSTSVWPLQITGKHMIVRMRWSNKCAAVIIIEKLDITKISASYEQIEKVKCLNEGECSASVWPLQLKDTCMMMRTKTSNRCTARSLIKKFDLTKMHELNKWTRKLTLFDEGECSTPVWPLQITGACMIITIKASNRSTALINIQ